MTLRVTSLIRLMCSSLTASVRATRGMDTNCRSGAPSKLSCSATRTQKSSSPAWLDTTSDGFVSRDLDRSRAETSRGSGGFLLSFDNGEVVPDDGFVVDEGGVETMAVEVEHEGAEDVGGQKVYGMIQVAAALLTRRTGYDVNRTFMRSRAARWFHINAGAVRASVLHALEIRLFIQR